MASKLPVFEWETIPDITSEPLHAQIAAVTLCMVGRCKASDLRKTVRALGTNPSGWECQQHLVRSGLKLHTISPLNMPSFVQAQDSFAFLKNYYEMRGVWGSGWAKFWKLEADSLQEQAKDQLQLSKKNSNYSLSRGEPSPEQIIGALDGTRVVSILVRPYGRKRTISVKPIVIREWQEEARQFLCYDPDYGQYIRIIALRELRKY